MPLAATSYEHIALDPQGVAEIVGANAKVVEMVLEVIAHGSSPEELHYQFPHLSLGQVHSALAYYWDHKAELDAGIERRWQRVERIRQQIGPTRLLEKLSYKQTA